MTNLPNYRITTILGLLLMIKLTAIGCSCVGRLTTEQELKQSDLVIQGRIIGNDTILTSNSLRYDNNGTKVGRQKLSVYKGEFLRVKFVVEKIFKFGSDIPDTIYIITNLQSTACGYPFMPFMGSGLIADSHYQYIVYADKWIEKSITKIKKGKKYTGQIVNTLLPDTFFTSTCKRTQNVNESELKNLISLSQ